MDTSTSYQRPDIRKIERMDFPFAAYQRCSLSPVKLGQWCEEMKKKCSHECPHYAPMGCRQCSGCHSCR